MSEYQPNLQEINLTIRKIEQFLLVALLFIVIPISAIAYIKFLNPRILNSLVTLITITALIQLEVSGLFDYLHSKLEKIHEESGCTPSNLTRIIYKFHKPVKNKMDCFLNHLYFNKRFGFWLLLGAELLQLYINYFI